MELGDKPDIAHKDGDTLYLHAGKDRNRLGELYEKVRTDRFTVMTDGGGVKVRSLGVTETFTGISKIVVRDAEEGNDSFYVGPGVGATVEFEGGTGNDTLVYIGQTPVRMIGGEGNDTLLGGLGNDYLDGGFGDDRILGSGGDDELIGGGGDDRIEGGAGNDGDFRRCRFR
ncbi:MAG UNVERIFIED_CONTAM: hypothetical protein LVR18_45835 [Planctomycetaceae bacterium]|jgi:Ca2+-binding RTX toxin-like protein